MASQQNEIHDDSLYSRRVADTPAIDPHLIDPEELRGFTTERQRRGGFRAAEVTTIVSRAAATIETLLQLLAEQRDEIELLEDQAFARTDERGENELTDPELPVAPGETAEQWRNLAQTAGTVLVTAHSAAANVLDEAQLQATRILASARVEADAALARVQRDQQLWERMSREGEAIVEGARLQADALLQLAQADRDELLAEALTDLDNQRALLATEVERLQDEITELKEERVFAQAHGFGPIAAVAEAPALAPIELSIVPDQPAASATTAKPETTFVAPLTASFPASYDVVAELRARLADQP